MEPKKYSARALASIDYNPCRFAGEKLVQKSQYIDKKGAKIMCGCVLHCTAKKLKQVPTPAPTTDFVYSKNFHPVVNWKKQHKQKLSPKQAQMQNSRNQDGDTALVLRRIRHISMSLVQAVKIGLMAKVQSANIATIASTTQMIASRIKTAALYHVHADNLAKKEKLTDLRQLITIAKGVAHELQGNKGQSKQFWEALLASKTAVMVRLV